MVAPMHMMSAFTTVRNDFRPLDHSCPRFMWIQNQPLIPSGGC